MSNVYKKQNQRVTTVAEGILLYFEILNETSGLVEYIDNEIIADDTEATITATINAYLLKNNITLSA